MTTAKQTIETLNAWLDAKPNRKIAIGWGWKGRDRAGYVTAYENGKELIQVCYPRNTQRWKDSDRDINSLRTGSSKHNALVQVAQAINA